MISTTGFRIAVGDQENKALTNRKSNLTKSARKPLGDRVVNQTPTQKYLKSIPLKDHNLSSHKKDVAEKPKESKVYPEWLADTCSFKEVDYDYEDICPKSKRLNIPELLNCMLNPKTPPIKGNSQFMSPLLLQSPLKKISIYDDDCISEIPTADVEIPDLSF